MKPSPHSFKKISPMWSQNRQKLFKLLLKSTKD